MKSWYYILPKVSIMSKILSFLAITIIFYHLLLHNIY